MNTNLPPCPYSADLAAGPIADDATRAARYHDNALAPADRSAFEQHLAGCPACAEELRRLSVIAAVLRALPMPSASRQFISALQDQWDRVPQLTVRRFVGRLTKVAAVVAVVAMGHLAYEAMAGHSAPPPVAAAPSVWEQAAITPPSTNSSADEQVASTGEGQFAEFIVQDLRDRGPGGRAGGRP